jgi:hypothetical protein
LDFGVRKVAAGTSAFNEAELLSSLGFLGMTGFLLLEGSFLESFLSTSFSLGFLSSLGLLGYYSVLRGSWMFFSDVFF